MQGVAVALAVTVVLGGSLTSSLDAARARTWVVHEDGTGDAPTIQAAVDLAAVGDTILVTAGTYTDIHEDVGGEFAGVEMKSGIVLRSTDGPAGTVIDVTSDEFARGIVCRNCGVGTVIEGFTITGGDAYSGAGILVDGGEPLIRGNVLREAHGGHGGSMVATGGATPEISENVFDSNEACCGNGGALLVDGGASPQVLSNVFTGNSGFEGGAVAIQNAGGLFEGNEFTGNTADGGAALTVWAGSPTIRGNTFKDNHSRSGGGAVQFRFSGAAEFHDNLVVGNVADGSGGGILVSGASPEIVGTTVAGNSAEQGGGIFITGGASPLLERVVVAFNAGEGGIVCDGPGSAPEFGCCNVYGNDGEQYAGQCPDPGRADGNFSADPRFCDMDGGDFALCSNSPCLPGNHPNGSDCDLIGALDAGCGDCQSLVTGLSWGAIKSIYR